MADTALHYQPVEDTPLGKDNPTLAESNRARIEELDRLIHKIGNWDDVVDMIEIDPDDIDDENIPF